MTFVGHRARFTGEIDRKSVSDLRKLDYELDSLEKRRGHIDNLVGTDGECRGFYDNYMDDYFKSNTTNELSEDINIFKSIETMGSYLLNSRDLEKESKQQYKIYTDEQLFKISLIEGNAIGRSGEGEQNIDEEQIMHYLMSNKRNEYYSKEMKITNSDFQDERVSEVLEQYDTFYQYLKEELNKIRDKKKSNINLYQARNMMKSVKDDMILAKHKIVRPIEITPSGDFSPSTDWDLFNFTDKEHIRAVLYMDKQGIIPDDDISLIVYDVNKALKELYKNGELDKTDMNIIALIRQDKSYTLSQIGEGLEVSQQAISKRIDKISKKIANYFK